MTESWALVTTVDLDTANLHIAALEDAGLLGLVEQSGRVTAYFDRRADGLPLPGRWERVPERDWNAVWKAGLRPVTVGGLTIAPPWIPHPGALVIEPGQAFGTGHHETTSACLGALQERPLDGARVLDVGTGTGVLALAARRLGAADVLGVDTDPVAVATARRNATVNGLAVRVLDGSVEAAPGRYDVVVANLDTRTLVALATALAARVRPGGRLIASGVAVEHTAEARRALLAAGLAPVVREGAAWALLVADRPPRGGR